MSLEDHEHVPAGIVNVVVLEVTELHAVLTSDSLHDAAVTCARESNGHMIIKSAIKVDLVFMIPYPLTPSAVDPLPGKAHFSSQICDWIVTVDLFIALPSGWRNCDCFLRLGGLASCHNR